MDYFYLFPVSLRFLLRVFVKGVEFYWQGDRPMLFFFLSLFYFCFKEDEEWEVTCLAVYESPSVLRLFKGIFDLGFVRSVVPGGQRCGISSRISIMA